MSPFSPRSRERGPVEADREAAERLGLIKVGQKVKPQEKPFAENWQTSVEHLSSALRDSLRDAFPERVVIDGDQATWTPKPEPEKVVEPLNKPLEFTAYKEAIKWADANIPPEKILFNPEQHKALVKAQGSTAVENAKLWKKEPFTEAEERWHDHMIEAFRKAPELPAIKVHHYAKAEDLGGVEKGVVIPWRGFLSTTMAPGGYVESKYQKGVHVTISVPEGARGIYMDRLNESTNKQEAEIMFPPGTKLVVKSKQMVNGVWEIEAELQ